MYTLRRSWLLIHKFKLQKLKNMSEDWRMSVSLCKWRFWCENTRFCMCKWEKILLVERDCHMAWSLVHRVLWMRRLPSTFHLLSPPSITKLLLIHQLTWLCLLFSIPSYSISNRFKQRPYTFVCFFQNHFFFKKLINPTISQNQGLQLGFKSTIYGYH